MRVNESSLWSIQDEETVQCDRDNSHVDIAVALKVCHALVEVARGSILSWISFVIFPVDRAAEGVHACALLVWDRLEFVCGVYETVQARFVLCRVFALKMATP